MAALKLEKTRTPGVYKRGQSYVVVYRHRGQQRKRCARTYAEARDLKATLQADIRRGEHREASTLTFEEYAREWIDSYTGRTSRGFKGSTRENYRFSIEQRAIPFFRDRTGTLAEIEPRDIRQFVAWLFEKPVTSQGRNGKKTPARLPAVSTVRGHVAPVKALLATAVEDGLIRHNPATGVRIVRPGAQRIEKDPAERRRALDSDELACFLDTCPEEWRLLFTLLAMTGLRISEAIELRWKDIDFGAKRLKVRRQFYGIVGEPKSLQGKRDIPLSTKLAQQMWAQHGQPDELVFTSIRGSRLDRDWCWKNVLKPTAKTAGVPWAGFHTFRHTCASILFANGKNPKQVQEWLGHSDPGFTLRTYVHLIDDGLGDADFLDGATWATPWATRTTETQANAGAAEALDMAV